MAYAASNELSRIESASSNIPYLTALKGVASMHVDRHALQQPYPALLLTPKMTTKVTPSYKDGNVTGDQLLRSKVKAQSLHYRNLG